MIKYDEDKNSLHDVLIEYIFNRDRRGMSAVTAVKYNTIQKMGVVKRKLFITCESLIWSIFSFDGINVALYNAELNTRHRFINSHQPIVD